MTVAEETRAAVRERPFLYDALAAGVANYAAAAETLDVDADADAVATALRRFAADLDLATTAEADARVTMQRRVGVVDADADVDTDVDDEEALLSVGGQRFAAGAGDGTAILATGTVDVETLERVLGRLRVGGVSVEAAAVTPSALAVVVGRRDGATALRVVEAVVDGA
ncbi:DUF7523 family protein [Halobaculum limi]|uniref:DUF7523 family protein n=1 Tax=Halobaculum limi TaxID=3031916 RepID=UPI0024074BB1|nr:hypothetical protein [Halobaculum sp. YSMS11]